MQCSNCGAILFDASPYCSNCGTLIEALPTPIVSSSPTLPEPALTMPAPSLPDASLTMPVQPTFPSQISAELNVAPGWAEFSSVQAPLPAGASAGSGAAYPSLTPVAGGYAPGYMAPGQYPNYPPNLMPPVAQPVIMQAPQRPRRRWPIFILGMIVGIVITLVFGSVVVSLSTVQAHPGKQIGATFVTPVPTPVVSPTSDPTQLYQQITSRTPTFVDALQDAAVSQWITVNKPAYSCEIKGDGLHIRIANTHEFYFCTSGHGAFINFAFQVEMTMLTGNGGGIVFRCANKQDNEYYFHVFPDGSYEVNIEQDAKFGVIIARGMASLSPIKDGMKNTLTVIAQGNKISLYFDQKLLKDFQDTTYTSGYVGVAADDFDAPAEVVYTNAKTWVL